jgi:hypothetical protein
MFSDIKAAVINMRCLTLFAEALSERYSAKRWTRQIVFIDIH